MTGDGPFRRTVEASGPKGAGDTSLRGDSLAPSEVFFVSIRARRGAVGAMFFVSALAAGLLAYGMGAEPSERAVSEALQAALGGGARETMSGLAKFYAGRGYRPLWIEDGSANAEASALFSALRSAQDHGLDPKLYGVEKHRKALDAARTADALAEVELALSTTLSVYASDLYGGRLDPSDLSPSWKLKAKQVDATSALESVASSGVTATLAKAAPSTEPYRALQAKLKALRVAAASGGASAVPVVGGESIPVEDAIARVEVGLERLRWAPRRFPQRYAWVDMAGFKLAVKENDRDALEMRVIIGERQKQTPMFRSTITYLVFNPSWTLPKSIALDLLPKIRRDPKSLERQGIVVHPAGGDEVLDPSEIDWRKVSEDRFPYRFEQPPGPKNPLGRVKFMFPNEFEVYLHDTPAGALFDRTVRTFSHGCVRLEKPLALAEYLLQSNSPPWTRRDIDTAIAKGETQQVSLKEPMPLFLWYQTAWVDSDSDELRLRPDVYGWDRPVQQALSEI